MLQETCSFISSNIYLYLLISVCFNHTVDAEKKTHDVERYNTGGDDTSHPTKGVNAFKSRSPYCFFSYCTQRKAKCRGTVACCWCECKVGYTFYSYEKGCLRGPQINAVDGSEPSFFFFSFF